MELLPTRESPMVRILYVGSLDLFSCEFIGKIKIFINFLGVFGFLHIIWKFGLFSNKAQISFVISIICNENHTKTKLFIYNRE